MAKLIEKGMPTGVNIHSSCYSLFKRGLLNKVGGGMYSAALPCWPLKDASEGSRKFESEPQSELEEESESDFESAESEESASEIDDEETNDGVSSIRDAIVLVTPSEPITVMELFALLRDADLPRPTPRQKKRCEPLLRRACERLVDQGILKKCSDDRFSKPNGTKKEKEETDETDDTNDTNEPRTITEHILRVLTTEPQNSQAILQKLRDHNFRIPKWKDPCQVVTNLCGRMCIKGIAQKHGKGLYALKENKS
eukprot:TRINITY_DN4750_c0_g1_i1.p1 TRINITY_DN4750_c0_g1~~TRINITY_DN4750_c0_g1_i1.p1  ORF type:complete len:254 (+),score=41.09 TRINITY_DN4750_c0_g1_i1:628-1389(+)